MKKLAFFVEGQTEQLFIEKLLLEIAGQHNIAIETKKFIGKKSGASTFVITAKSKISTQKYFALISDCGGDSRVQSEIIDQHESLVKAEFAMILGLRDLHPHALRDLNKVKLASRKYVPTKTVSPEILISVMEVEAWFIAEHSHFAKIHSSLTPHTIRAATGIDVTTHDVESIPLAAATLHDIYQIAGDEYTKRAKNALRTIETLDYAAVYMSLNSRVRHLGYLIDKIEEFLM